MLLFSAGNVISQKTEGKVFELHHGKHKVPLTGASVYWMNSRTGTITDTNGYFFIPEPVSGHRILIVSFVGYQPDTLHVPDDKQYVEVTLKESHTLQEVTVEDRMKGTHVSRMDPIHTQNISSAELHKAACCNLSESFETNASVDVNYTDAVSGAKQIRLLGLAGKYSQILTENIPNLRGLASAYGLNYIPGPWMESIQISKGTGSVINGYESITGQINVEFLKPDVSDKFYLNLYQNYPGKSEVNLYNSYRLNEKWSTMLFAHGEHFSAEIDHNDDSFLDVPELKQVNVFNRWKYIKNERYIMQFGIKALAEDRTGGQLSFNPDIQRDTTNGYGINIRTNRYELFFKTGYRFPGRPNTSLGFVSNAILHDQEAFFGLKDYLAQQQSLYGNLIWQSYISNTNHQYSTGLSIMYDNYDESLDSSDLSKEEIVPGAFFQYTYKYLDVFTLIAGIRGDVHNRFGAMLTPRLHAKYDLNEKTTVRAAVGKGYRTPHIIAENSWLLASSRNLMIEEDILQEEAWNYGANLTRYFSINNRKMTVNLEFYRTDFQNMAVIDIDREVSSIYIYNLQGSSFANSLQAEVSYEPVKNLDAVIAFRINDVKTTTNGELQEKPLAGRYKGLLTLSYLAPGSGWQFDATWQLNGDGRIPETDNNTNGFNPGNRFDPYSIFNLQVTKLFDKWEFYAGVENLGNFVQKNPVIAPERPFSNDFDASLVWGPVFGRKIYGGLRYTL